MGLVPDPTKLTPEQRDKLERYQQVQSQLQTLGDIADISQEILNVMDEQKTNGSEVEKKFGSLLVDIRESIVALVTKDEPEMPDYAQPVVKAVDKLSKELSRAIKTIDVKPVMDAPQVNVAPTEVDLRGVEKAVDKLGKAFQDAIKLIQIPEVPKTDFKPLLDAWNGISEQLVSIETATRMKPLPGNMGILVNGSSVSASNPLPITGGAGGGLTDTELRATPVPTTESNPITGFATSAKQDTAQTSFDTLTTDIDYRYAGGKIAYSTTLAASGDTTIITPASGKRIQVYWIAFVPNSDNTAANLISLGFGTTSGAISTELYRGYAMAHWELFTGTADQSVIVNAGTAQPVAITIHYKEIV